MKRVRIEIVRYTRIVSTNDRSVSAPDLDLMKLVEHGRGARWIPRFVRRLVDRWRRRPAP
jgi:hypothetical protein